MIQFVVRADVNRHVETRRTRTCRAWHGRHRRQQSSSCSMNSGLDGMEGGNGRSSLFPLFSFFFLFLLFLFSNPVVMELEGWMILDGRPVGQSNCSGSSRHPRSNVPSLRPHPVKIHLFNNCTQRCEKERRRRKGTLVGSTCHQV